MGLKAIHFVEAIPRGIHILYTNSSTWWLEDCLIGRHLFKVCVYILYIYMNGFVVFLDFRGVKKDNVSKACALIQGLCVFGSPINLLLQSFTLAPERSRCTFRQSLSTGFFPKCQIEIYSQYSHTSPRQPKKLLLKRCLGTHFFKVSLPEELYVQVQRRQHNFNQLPKLYKMQLPSGDRLGKGFVVVDVVDPP